MPREWLPSRLPIIQAPMAGSQGVELCVAVSEAGGLGSIPSAMLTPAILRDQIAEIRARTRAPFNVNFFCHEPPAPDPERHARWLERLAGAYAEAGLDPSAAGSGPGRAPFDAAMAEVVEATKPPVVSFHFGLPEGRCRAGEGGGSKGLFLRDDSRRGALARSARRRCGDRARGGGRRPSRHVPERGRRRPAGPVRASAAGRRRGSAFRSSRLAGSPTDGASRPLSRSARSAAQIGTAYLKTPQAATSALAIARRCAKRRDDATRLTNLFTGRPARGLLNRFMREHGPMNDAAPAFPLATGAVAPLRAYWEKRGSGDYSPLWAGQAAALAREEDAGALTERLWREAKATLAALRLEP